MDIPVDIIAASGIQRGTILHSTLFEYIDHGKFFVIVGVTKDYVAGFFFVNSNINKYIWSKPEQLAMQCVLRHSNYDFLNYDSFLSAVKINEIPCEKLARSIKDGITKIVGMLKDEDMCHLLEKARNSRLFSKKEKEMYFYK